MAGRTFAPHYAWTILVTGTLVVFAALGLARFGYTLVLPSMQVGLGMDNSGAGALATANLLGYLALSAVGGALASRYGPRAVIVTGLSLTAAGMIATGAARGYADAALWRAVTGIGSGASNVPVMGLMAAWFASRRRGLATGIAAGGSSLGLILLGPLVPAVLSAAGEYGWRICWFGFGGMTVAVALLAGLLLRNSPADRGLLPFGASAPVVKSAAPGALSWGRVYRAPSVWNLGLVYVAFGFSYIIYVTFFYKYLVDEIGWTRADAGGLFMLVGWCSLFCGVIWGAVSDRIGRPRALVLVYLLQAASYLLFALPSGTAGHIGSALLFGITAWSVPAIMAAACGDMLGPRLAPAALGFITLFFGIGQAVGPWAAGGLADLTGSFRAAFGTAAAVAAAGAIGAAFLRTVESAEQ